MTSRALKTKVYFPSGGIQCAGYFFQPASIEKKLPCIIMGHGFTGTMEQLVRHAGRFARAGFAVLIFDYRYFGESEGEPRQLVDIIKQREDWHAAIAWARQQPQVNSQKIAIWGTSLSGGHVLKVGSEDPFLAAVISQCPGIDIISRDSRVPLQNPALTTIKTVGAAVRDRLHGFLGLQPYYMKVFGQPGEAAAFTDQNLKGNFELLMRDGMFWRNYFTPRFYFNMPRYESGTAEKIKGALLVCIADQDVYASPAFAEKVGRKAKKSVIKHYDVAHFDFYNGETFEQVVQDQISFLNTHLAGREKDRPQTHP